MASRPTASLVVPRPIASIIASIVGPLPPRPSPILQPPPPEISVVVAAPSQVQSVAAVVTSVIAVVVQSQSNVPSPILAPAPRPTSLGFAEPSRRPVFSFAPVVATASATPVSPASSSSPESGNSTLVIGLIVCSVGLVILAFFGVFFFNSMREKKREKRLASFQDLVEEKPRVVSVANYSLPMTGTVDPNYDSTYYVPAQNMEEHHYAARPFERSNSYTPSKMNQVDFHPDIQQYAQYEEYHQEQGYSPEFYYTSEERNPHGVYENHEQVYDDYYYQDRQHR